MTLHREQIVVPWLADNVIVILSSINHDLKIESADCYQIVTSLDRAQPMA